MFNEKLAKTYNGIQVLCPLCVPNLPLSSIPPDCRIPTARDIPQTPLGSFIERRIEDRIQKYRHCIAEEKLIDVSETPYPKNLYVRVMWNEVGLLSKNENRTLAFH